MEEFFVFKSARIFYLKSQRYSDVKYELYVRNFLTFVEIDFIDMLFKRDTETFECRLLRVFGKN